MTDAVAIFPPGFRVLDADGAPVSGAQIRFFEAGTSTPLDVFSDSDLADTLGSIVYTRSDGYPVAEQASNTTVSVFMGALSYKVDILDADGVTIYPAKDDQVGAVDTTDFLTSADTATLIIPVTAIAVNTSIGASHKGKLIQASGAIILTFGDPAVLGDDWNVRIRCNDATNPIKLVASAGAFKGSGFSIAGIALVGLGNAVDIVCDGGNFIIDGRVPGGGSASGKIFTIESRVSSAPATTPGLFYIVTSGFSGFSVGDIIEATGQATFIGYTPPSNCGWLAYVKAESLIYSFQSSAWTPVFFTAAQMPVGTVCARAYAEYATNASLSTVIPHDDTIPQITEGTEIVTASLTPKSITNRIRVTFSGQVNGVAGAVEQVAIVALFQDAAVDALFAKFASVMDTSGSSSNIAIERGQSLDFVFEYVPATLSAITLRVRAGANAGSIRFNGVVAARRYGGVSKATLTLEEIVA